MHMSAKTKMVIIGIDSISMRVMDQMVERGYCPTIERLIKNGCYGLGRSFCPVETGTNWAVLSTGASPMIAGCNMGLHLPGMPLNSTTRGFPSELCRAEQIWNAARRAGKRSVIFDYPQSRPYNCEDVIHVGEDGRPGQGYRALSEMHAYKTEPYDTSRRLAGLQSFVTQIEMRPAEGWANLPSDGCLAAEMPITPGPCSELEWAGSMWLLLAPDSGGSCTTATVCGAKDYASKMGEVKVGKWSDPLIYTFDTSRGPVEASSRAKLFRLSPDGRDVHIYFHQIYPTDGFAHPDTIEKKLYELCGPYYPHGCRQQSINSGAADVWTFHDELDFTVGWYLKAMDCVLSNEHWDLFIQKWHPPDFAYHFGAFMIDPAHPLFDPQREQEGWDYWGKVMNYGDQLVAKAMEIAGDDAIIAVMSDHGGRMVLPGQAGHGSLRPALEKAGLVATGNGGIDWSKTRAWGSQHYAWVNLKGRDPQGCVEPADYEDARRQIMNALLDYTDPHTGHRPFNLVCTREDANMVGVGSDIAGDVFVWTEQPATSEPIAMEEFRRRHPGIDPGTWEWPNHNSGTHSPDPFMIMAGPGLGKGCRQDRATWINYFAPTLATAWGIPAPKDADGGVIWEFLA